MKLHRPLSVMNVVRYPGMVFLLMLAACQQGPDLSSVRSDLEPALKEFASYEFGQPKKILHDTRMAAYRGTDNRLLRQKNEQLLLEFVQSEATVDARRRACLWLSDLGSPASEAILQKLGEGEAFADVAQIALDAIAGRAATSALFDSGASAFRTEISHSDDPLPLLKKALTGENEDRARQAFAMVRDGTKTQEVSEWLAGKILELPAHRQIIAINVLLQVDVPEKATVIEQLSRQAKGDVRVAAIRHLGFLQRREDVPYLMDHYLGSNEELADSARAALRAYPLKAIREPLMAALQGPKPATQARAIQLVEITGAEFATERLLRIAGDAENENRSAAIRALGRVAPAERYPQMIQYYIQSAGTEVEAAYKEALWDHSRRQFDYKQAQKVLEEHLEEAPASSQKVIQALSKKLGDINTESRKK
jgi:HEAT repeat protein